MKKLNKVEKFLLENEGPKYNSFRCPTHGVYQRLKSVGDSKCTWSTCAETPEVIEDAKAYAASH